VRRVLDNVLLPAELAGLDPRRHRDRAGDRPAPGPPQRITASGSGASWSMSDRRYASVR